MARNLIKKIGFSFWAIMSVSLLVCSCKTAGIELPLKVSAAVLNEETLNLNVKDAVVTTGAPLKFTCIITFNQEVDLNEFAKKCSLKQDPGSSGLFELKVSKDNSRTLRVELPQDNELLNDTSYVFTVARGLSKKVGDYNYVLNDPIEIKFKTYAVSSEAKMFVNYFEDIGSKNNVFYVTLQEGENIQRVPLTIGVSEKARLFMMPGEEELDLVNYFVSTQLDFSQTNSIDFKVQAQDKTTTATYTIQTLLPAVNLEITSFKFSQRKNILLRSDITGVISRDRIIRLEVEDDVDISDLRPTIEHTGRTISPANEAPVNFRGRNVIYTISNDEQTVEYTVVVGIKGYIVKFNSNGGSSVADIQVPVGGMLTLPSPPSFEGFIFSGWYTDITLKNRFDPNTIINSDLTLHAKWREP